MQEWSASVAWPACDDSCVPGMRGRPEHCSPLPARHGRMLPLRHGAGAYGRAERRRGAGVRAGGARALFSRQHPASDAFPAARRVGRGARDRRHFGLFRCRMADHGRFRGDVRDGPADGARGDAGRRARRARARISQALAGAPVQVGGSPARVVHGAGLSGCRRRDLQPGRGAARHHLARGRLVLRRRRGLPDHCRGVA